MSDHSNMTRVVIAQLSKMCVDKAPSADMTRFLETNRCHLTDQTYFHLRLSIATTLMHDEKYEEAYDAAKTALDEYGDASPKNKLTTLVFMATNTSYFDQIKTLEYTCHRDDIVQQFGLCDNTTFDFDTAICRAKIILKKYAEVHPFIVNLIKRMRTTIGSKHTTTLATTLWLVLLYNNTGKLHRARPLVDYLVKHKKRLTDTQNETLDTLKNIYECLD